MSSHIGVSCDSCSKTNFPTRRYKCLKCDNYDLCGSCYDNNSESQHHLNTHPMQCILTKTAYELFYTGESIPYRTIVSLTCPYCGASGFVPHTLLMHCLDKHSIISSDNKTNQVVMCPICIVNPLQGHQSRFVSLADHIAREHDDEDLQRFENKKEDFDEDEDEDDGIPLYVLAERLFMKEENRRQRLAQMSGRIDLNSDAISQQQRPLSGQAALRGSRGNMRVPRTTTGSFRIPFDTTIENAISSDPYTAILFSQDSLFDFDSTFSDLTTIAPFFLTSSAPTHIPSVEPTTNNRLIQKKSILLNTKQKRSTHIQQQPTPPVILPQPSTSDYQLWQQNLPSSSNNLTDTTIITENSSKNPRSLLGKILKTDHNNESIRIHSEQNHISFLQSLFLSSIHIEQLY